MEDDGDCWVYTNDEYEGSVRIILSLGASSNTGGTWRSTADKVPGLVVEGGAAYTKDSTELTEIPVEEPGRVTINYVDTEGNILKSIYRVGAVGKTYTTYEAEIEGYTLTERPSNATGTFEVDGTVTYVYSNVGPATPTPTPTAPATPTPIQTPQPTLKPSVVTTNTTVSVTTSDVKVQTGDRVTDSASKATFRITKNSSSSKTVEYIVSGAKSELIVVPDVVNINGKQYKVTSIADGAFKNNQNVKSIVIGKNVKAISSNAFYGCKKLQVVSGLSNVTTIGSQAFYKCTSLTSVTMSSNVKTIGSKAFYKCTKLTKITIPAKVTKIGSKAFYGCSKLKTITIKTTKLTSSKVGSKAFKGIYSKATIKVPKSRLSACKKILKAKGIGTKATVKGV